MIGRIASIPLVAGVCCLVATAAHANGRLPGATGLAIHPSDERQLLLGLSYGLALSRDGGASWTWVCEEQIEGNGGDVDPSVVVTGNGTLVVLSLTNGGVLVSRDDGCSFARATGPLQGERGVDLTLDPSRPGRVLALMSTISEVVDRSPRFRNWLAHSLDHGRSWEVLAELPDDLAAETLELAPSEPDRIYVSGTAGADPLQGIVERSDDGGRTWKRTTVRLPHGSGSLFLSGIHPRDPDRLWFRVPGRGDLYGVLPARLWLSPDGGTSFEAIGDTQGGMLGFAVSPDGARVAFGGPLDGLFVAPADGSAAPTRIADVRVACLRWRDSGLYVCAGEPSDPYGLGHAVDPTVGFVPLWHRADTCRDACTPDSSLEQKCREPWEAIAALVDAKSAVCGAAPMPTDAGVDAGVDAGSASIEPRSVPASTEGASSLSASGCAVASVRGVGPPCWLAAMLLLACACTARSVRARAALLVMCSGCAGTEGEIS